MNYTIVIDITLDPDKTHIDVYSGLQTEVTINALEATIQLLREQLVSSTTYTS